MGWEESKTPLLHHLSHLQSVEALRIVINDFSFRLAAQVFAGEVLVDELAHVRAGRFMGEVGGPQQTVVAEQLDIAFGSDFFSALKIDLLSFQELAG